MIIMMIILDRFGFGSRDQLVNIGHQFVIFSMLRAPLSMVSLNKFIAEIFIAAGLYANTGELLSNNGHFSVTLEEILKLFLVNKHNRAVFAGIETGTISYYKLSDDLNVLESVQTFNAHSSAAVVQCYFCPLRNWILSIGAEGNFVWSELNGNKLGNYILPSKPRCFQVS